MSAESPQPELWVPPRIRKHIDLPSATQHPPLQTPLGTDQARTLAATTVPVLVADHAAFLAAAIATAEPDWYALSGTFDGITVHLQGDRVATVDPGLVPADWQPPTWQAPFVTRNEGVVQATFLAWGASYRLSIECADPSGDARCTADDTVRSWVASLRRWSTRHATGGAP